jgi:hypothetical protein
VTFELLRRDAAFRSLPAWIVVGAIAASALEGVRTLAVFAGAKGNVSASPESFLLLVIFWLPLAAYLTFGRTNQRCSRFDLTMPVAARRLWWIHFAAVTSSGLVLLLAVAGVVRLRDGLIARLIDRTVVPESDLASLALPLFAGVVLAVAVLQISAPTLYRIPTSKRYVLLSLLGSALLLGLLMVLVALPNVFALIPLAFAGVVGWRGSRLVPAGFTLIPRQSSAASDVSQSDPTKRGAGWAEVTPLRHGGIARRLSVLATAFGVLSRGIAPGALWKVSTSLIQLPLLFVWGLIVAGAIFGGEDVWLFFVVITVYLLLAFLGGPMSQLHLLDPLPISRRHTFGLLVLPGFLAIAAGYGAGTLVTHPAPGAEPAIELTSGRSSLAPHYRLESPMVRVPIESLAIARNGVPPMMEAPWGETHEPWSIPLARSSRAVLFSPYSTPEGSSPEFIALQLSRAMSDVYGATLSPDEVGQRFLVGDASGGVAWKKDAFTAWLAAEGLQPRRPGPLFPVLFTTIGVLWLITAWSYMRSFRATNSDLSRKWAFFGLLGVLLALHIGVTVAAMGTLMRPWVAVGVPRMLIRRLAEALPGGTSAVWVAGIVIFGIVYLLVRRRFERIEVSAPRTVQEG